MLLLDVRRTGTILEQPEQRVPRRQATHARLAIYRLDDDLVAGPDGELITDCPRRPSRWRDQGGAGTATFVRSYGTSPPPSPSGALALCRAPGLRPSLTRAAFITRQPVRRAASRQ